MADTRRRVVKDRQATQVHPCTNWVVCRQEPCRCGRGQSPCSRPRIFLIRVSTVIASAPSKTEAASNPVAIGLLTSAPRLANNGDVLHFFKISCSCRAPSRVSVQARQGYVLVDLWSLCYSFVARALLLACRFRRQRFLSQLVVSLLVLGDIRLPTLRVPDLHVISDADQHGFRFQ